MSVQDNQPFKTVFNGATFDDAETGNADAASRQYAALCYRRAGRKYEVLLITSRDTGRWIIPKGWPIGGLAPHEAAAREAFEEAGVNGAVDQHCIGLYCYDKRTTATRSIPCLVAVYPLKFQSFAREFPEKGQRRHKWFAPEKAATKVHEPDLAALLKNFAGAGLG